VYARGPAGSLDLAWIPADGSDAPKSLLVAPGEQWPGAVAPDRRTVIFVSVSSGSTARSIHFLALDGTAMPRPLVSNAFDNHSPTLSPDGRWFAYVSDESGRNEVYARPFPGPGGRWQVSLEGGSEPRWSPTGREIFYRNANRMMSAVVQTQPEFTVGERRPLFQGNFARSPGRMVPHPMYDVTRDGQTFLMLRRLDAAGQTLMVVQNWFANLAPGGGQ
jgi:eukaryotic-like serine/threonine-protein kinase